MRYFIAFIGTIAPILICFIMGILCLYAYITNKIIVFTDVTLLVTGIVFIVSCISPFKYGEIYRTYYDDKQKEK